MCRFTSIRALCFMPFAKFNNIMAYQKGRPYIKTETIQQMTKRVIALALNLVETTSLNFNNIYLLSLNQSAGMLVTFVGQVNKKIM